MIGGLSPLSGPTVAPPGLKAAGTASDDSRAETGSGLDVQDSVAISGATPAAESRDGAQARKSGGQSGDTTPSGDKKLSDEQQQQVAELKKIDQSVRQHEQAHAAAGGSLAGAPSYKYTTGPDGRRYAVEIGRAHV